MLLLLLVCCTIAAYWAGTRGQRYGQSRADAHDARGKLDKARDTRAELRGEAIVSWLALLGLVVLVFAVAWRQ